MSATNTPKDFEADIGRRIAALSGPRPGFAQRWTIGAIIMLVLYLAFLAFGLWQWSNALFDPATLIFTQTLGIIGIWRYGWWFNHIRRAETFRAWVWPEIRDARDETWAAGWRPRHLHVQMTTYFEKPEITRHVLRALLEQVRETAIPTTIWVGTGTSFDEKVIRDFVTSNAADLDTEIVFIRQNQPGKRMAIGLIMRAIIRRGTHPDDLVLFMDGDSVLGANTLAKCCGMFGADPELQALTTDEEVISYGPNWVERWLKLRFAQRRLAMQSHVMSNKVLTLTGRMSMFRGRHILNERFVRTIEADHLDHWLWGRFRFLSGDDKSTWYHMLTCGAKMGYVPDATVFTVEVIEGNGTKRMVQNLRRWSGNMLRNGSRAIRLGPRKIEPFIWMCIVDQRIAIWTMLLSPALVLMASFHVPTYFVSAFLWVVISRLLLSLFLFRFSRSVDMTWPLVLYINQVVNASVKVFLQFFLAKQTWANRGGQKARLADGVTARIQSSIATFQMVTAISAFLWIVSMMAGVTEVPIFR